MSFITTQCYLLSYSFSLVKIDINIINGIIMTESFMYSGKVKFPKRLLIVIFYLFPIVFTGHNLQPFVYLCNTNITPISSVSSNMM